MTGLDTNVIADKQARTLTNLPADETRKGPRDRALLARLPCHGLWREELCPPKVEDIHSRRGVPNLRIHLGEKAAISPYL